MKLQVHLENFQPISFPENQSLNSVVNNPTIGQIMLTHFFEMNRTDNLVKKLGCLYVEFPQYFVWSQKYRIWQPRKKCEVVGMILTVHPSEGDQ